MDLALNNLQRLICHKAQQTKLINPVCISKSANTMGNCINPSIPPSTMSKL